MLPPIDDAVLQSNPDFAALYNTLTTVILNRNGSTKIETGAKERDAVREELKVHRLKAARHHLLTQALSTAVPAEPKPRSRAVGAAKASSEPATTELPSELLDLLVLLPALLTTTTAPPPASLRQLLTSPPFSTLDSHLPQLATLLSTTLNASAIHLARMTNPSTNPSFLHRHIAPLPSQIATQQATLADNETALAAARQSCLAALLSLLSGRARALAAALRVLETKHGTVSRALELRAADVALATQRGALDAEAALYGARGAVYSSEAAAALAAYTRHLDDAKGRVEEGIAAAQRQLEEYGVGVAGGDEGGGEDEEQQQDEEAEGDRGGARSQDNRKERTLREIARMYRETGRQIAETQADLARLTKR